VNFVGFRQLHRDIEEFSTKLPPKLVGAIGVPRSGLMVASLLTLHCGDIRLGSVTGWLGHGLRVRRPIADTGVVVLLDDSLCTGTSIQKALQQCLRWCHNYRVFTGALYINPRKQTAVDCYLRVLKHPRLFAWNWIGSAQLRHVLADVDGVICKDPPVQDDDGEAYQSYIRHAQPLHLPFRPVGGLITGRLSRWRSLTTAWLREHGVQHRRLIMYEANTATERRRRGDVAEWKGRVFRDGPWKWMIESSKAQAPRISRVAQKPVICLGDERVYR